MKRKRNWLIAMVILTVILAIFSLKTEFGHTVILVDNTINLNLPKDWEARQINESGAKFYDDTGQNTGGIFLVGYDPNQPNASLPNHSETLNEALVRSPIGSGRIYTLERSFPAAGECNEKWIEIHAILISEKENMAYDLWIRHLKGQPEKTKKQVETILNSMSY